MKHKRAYKCRFYPTEEQKRMLASKSCFDCGHILTSLKLDSRHWVCPACGVTHDRDMNAARNTHAVGLTVFEACGEAVRPGAVKTKPGKSPLARVGSPGFSRGEDVKR